MIRVKYGRPAELPDNADFEHKCHANLKWDVSIDAGTVDRYAFHKSVGKIKSVLDGLAQIQCTANITARIENEFDMDEGEVIVWDEESGLVADEAAHCISDTIRNISHRWGNCRLLLEYKLTREIVEIK